MVNKKDYLLFGVFAVALIIIIILLSFIKSEGGQCLKNPYIYGASKMGDVQCSCLQFKNPTCPARFSFSDDGFVAEVTQCGTGLIQNIDLNNLKINITP